VKGKLDHLAILLQIKMIVMKRILLIFFCSPIFVFGQSIDCDDIKNLDNLNGKQIKFVDLNNSSDANIVTLHLKGNYVWKDLKDYKSKPKSIAKTLSGSIVDRWWISDYDNTLNILYNNYITYKFPIGSGYVVQKGTWTNIKPNSGSVIVLSIDKEIQEYTPQSLPCLIKEYVESRINSWQIKGEFEKISTYNQRVNEISRKNKIDLFQKEAFVHYKKVAMDNLVIGDITLEKYDAENETFLLETGGGPFLLPVPINEAKLFKEKFTPHLFTNLDMVMKDSQFIISNIEYGSLYRYNISDNYSYSNTTFNYNFDEIDIDIQESHFSNNITTSNNTISIGKSIVDSDIPKNRKVSNRYALVIGNEDYKSMQKTLSSEQNVDYAANDAEIFKDYALKTLGVPEENLHFMINATAGQMHQEIDLITKIVGKIGTNAELIVYYAGHGFPDEQTKTPYLIPVDVTASNLSSAIKLEDFYTKLSSTNASKIIVFLDACFTGGGRNKSLVSSRGIKIKPKQGSLSGNLVVFSASNGDQSSLPFHAEKHGMFTYHLLKRLKDTKGSTTFGELYTYLEEKVSLESLKVNRTEQAPKINVSSQVKSQWLNWKF
jgi:hypothetical protein